MSNKARTLAALMAICLASLATAIWGLGDIQVLDQGDYQRMVSRMLVVEPEAQAFHAITRGWTFREDLPVPNLSSGSLSILVYALTLVQHASIGHYSGAFSLAVMLCICLLSFSWLGRTAFPGKGTCIAIFAGIGMLSVLLPHTLAFLGSFYGEALFIALLPAALAFLPRRDIGWTGAGAMFVVVTACATSKSQVFYLPAMMLVWRALPFWNRSAAKAPPSDAPAAVALILSQLIAILPVAAGDYSHVNAHNSLYFGSLMAAEPLPRSANVAPACIGADYWGNRIASLDDVHPVAGPACHPLSPPTLASAMGPYLANPLLLLEIAHQALPVHATFSYFVLNADNAYVHVPDTAASRILAPLEQARSVFLDGFLLFIMPAIVLAVSFAFPRRQAMLLTFCATFAVSQIVVAIAGEGVRDLSRHLIPAQISAQPGLLMTLCLLVSERPIRRILRALETRRRPSSP